MSGTVLDGQTGRPVPGAIIAINGQSSDRNVTDSDGRFQLTASPGSYTLRFSAAKYLPMEVSDVIVKPGEVTEVSTLLSSQSAVTSVEVVGKIGALDATAAAMLTERRLAPVVSDGISREELAGSTSSNAAGALEKVTGVSVVGEGFVYVRGLGERYSATQLNGAVVPTTEPEKRVVPLDLFPSGLIENIKIDKTYSPDLPAEFSGGLVELQTVEFPAQKVFNISFKSGFNTVTSYSPFLNNPGGGSADFFGYGAGSRGLPAIIPTNGRLFPGRYTPQQFQDFGRAFADVWQPASVSGERPAFDWSASGGGTFGRIGIVGAVSFSNRPQTYNEVQRYFRPGPSPTEPDVFTDYPDYHQYIESARLGAVFNAAVHLTNNHKLVFRNTYTHEGENSAREIAGYDRYLDANLEGERLHYVERSLYSTGVEGDHSFSGWHNSLFRWQFTYSRSDRNEPDLREVFRHLLPNGQYIFVGTSTSGLRFFSALNDRIYEPQADFSIPFYRGSVTGLMKVGYRATIRRRDFQARRFVFTPVRISTLDLYLPSDELFAPENIRPDGFQILEYTRGTDTYGAEMNVQAGYAMVDLSLGARWRIVGGVRIEDADQIVSTIDNLVPSSKPVTASLHNTDPVPAINAIYALTRRQNLRVSYSRTLSRPDFRELSPFDYTDVQGGFVTTGNPNLVRATINNYDARWEWFPGGNQLVAASLFAKLFTNPIERTILPSNDLRQSFSNAAGARNIGVELEYRRSLASLWRKLREFGVASNVTIVDSNIELRDADATIVTSQSRPLLGQSRYIANGILEWRRPKWHSEAKFFANYVSRRISNVGFLGLPDLYEEGSTFLDLTYQYRFGEKGNWIARLEAENLGNNDYRWTQGGAVQREYHLGRNFQIGLSYSFF